MSDDNFASSDFPLVAYLLTDSRIQLVGTEAVTPTRTRFFLAPKALCESLAHDYLADRVTVSPKVFHDSCRHLKSLLHAVRRGEGLGR